MVKLRKLSAPFIDINILPHDTKPQSLIKAVICSNVQNNNQNDIPGGYNYVNIVLAIDGSRSASGIYENFEERSRPIETAVNLFINSFAPIDVVKEIDIWFWATDPRYAVDTKSTMLPYVEIDCSQEQRDDHKDDKRLKWNKDKEFLLHVIRPHLGAEMGLNVEISSLLKAVEAKAQNLQAEVNKRENGEKSLLVVVILATDYIKDENNAKSLCKNMAKEMDGCTIVPSNSPNLSMVKFVLVQVAKTTQPDIAKQQQRFDDMFEGEKGYPDLWTHIQWQDFGEQGLQKPEWLWEAIFAELHSEKDAAMKGYFKIQYTTTDLEDWHELEMPVELKQQLQQQWPAKITIDLPRDTKSFRLIKDEEVYGDPQNIPKDVFSEKTDQVSCFTKPQKMNFKNNYNSSIISLNFDKNKKRNTWIESVSYSDDSENLKKTLDNSNEESGHNITYDFDNSYWVDVCMKFLWTNHASTTTVRIVLDAELMDNIESFTDFFSDFQNANTASNNNKIMVYIWNYRDEKEIRHNWNKITSTSNDIFSIKFMKKEEFGNFYSVFCYLEESDSLYRDVQQNNTNNVNIITLFLFSNNGIPDLNLIIEESRLLTADKWLFPGSNYHMIIVDVDSKTDKSEHNTLKSNAKY